MNAAAPGLRYEQVLNVNKRMDNLLLGTAYSRPHYHA